jgi:hypothetical protein
VAIKVWTRVHKTAPVLEALLMNTNKTKVLDSVQVQWPEEDTTIVLIFPKDPRTTLSTPGNYTVVVHTKSSTSNNGTRAVLAERTHAIIRVDDAAPVPKVHIDAQQRLVVKSTPIFPIGLYFQSYLMTEQYLKMVGDSAFNLVMPYDTEKNNTASKAQMDIAHSHGVHVIAQCSHDGPLNQQRVQALRDHPALVGW